MNYEDMSDLVIDRKVFVQMYGECIGDKDMHRVWQDNKFRPCSNPAIAWSIIASNGICINFRKGKSSLVGIYGECPNECECGGEFRAAMICFLKMKDAEK